MMWCIDIKFYHFVDQLACPSQHELQRKFPPSCCLWSFLCWMRSHVLRQIVHETDTKWSGHNTTSSCNRLSTRGRGDKTHLVYHHTIRMREFLELIGMGYFEHTTSEQNSRNSSSVARTFDVEILRRPWRILMSSFIRSIARTGFDIISFGSREQALLTSEYFIGLGPFLIFSSPFQERSSCNSCGTHVSLGQRLESWSSLRVAVVTIPKSMSVWAAWLS